MVDKSLNAEFIDAHNEYRALHGCGKLKFDMALARSAQKYAEQLAQLGYMNHSSCDGYGENLAARSSSGVAIMTGREATKMWYDEIILHDFKGGYNGATGHFSQVIWKNTTNAGFGRASTKDGHKMFMVGHYTPPGNVQGEFEANVPRLTSRKKSSVFGKLFQKRKKSKEPKVVSKKHGKNSAGEKEIVVNSKKRGKSQSTEREIVVPPNSHARKTASPAKQTLFSSSTTSSSTHRVVIVREFEDKNRSKGGVFKKKP
ncbi:unnamed protein product [Fasciola hepatica]|uniref:SCP domain-containing protein n=1 Tax=Fasciola hepatica TaxID=6192 RepID=A0ABC9HII6_FASHE|nr:unnamed protein product [Fasciola hepatica]